jgi:hypothetical protein
MKTRSISLLAASLLVLTVSQSVSAQENAGADAEQAAPAEETAPAEEAAPVEEAAPAEEAAPSEEAAPAEAAPSEATAPAEEAAAADAEPKIGPGGKPLREDYPGTEESLQARMDTQRIEGLTFNEGESADEVYDLRIRELETKVDDLKETVFRSKSRIVLLKETVLNGTIAGSRAVVSHLNELGATYELQRAFYSLDGARIFNEKDTTGALDDKDHIEVYKGSISPGTHRISVLMELQGSGFNLFSYMDGYKFSVQDSCEFTAQEGRSVIVQVRLYEKGGAFSSYEESLGIDCSVSLVDLSQTDLVDEEQADAAGGTVATTPDESP